VVVVVVVVVVEMVVVMKAADRGGGDVPLIEDIIMIAVLVAVVAATMWVLDVDVVCACISIAMAMATHLNTCMRKQLLVAKTILLTQSGSKPEDLRGAANQMFSASLCSCLYHIDCISM
jgi:hypothetical protein